MFNKERGITLIALVITVIVILILSIVAVSAITGNDGLFSKANEAGTLYNQKAESEHSEIQGMLDWADWGNGEDNGEIDYSDLLNNDSLLSKAAELTQAGIQDITVNGITYKANVIILNENVVLNGTNTYAGSTITTEADGVNVYEFGDKTTDVATATVDAQNMVILKVNGNLTIEQGVKLTACKSDDGFGGPKGMLIYCNGILTNNGEISMTARGARAAGEDVYLWKNASGSYETVPAVGGSGGLGDATTSGKAGGSGANAENRQTGGGGAGGSGGTNPKVGGSGAKGTSYSGGAGGGGTYHTSGTGTYQGENAKLNGGAGGAGAARGYDGVSAYASGGAGNGIGKSAYATTGTNAYGNKTNPDAENGTGGLLILYAGLLSNNGIITSNGSNVTGHKYSDSDRYSGGGASGGGSVNIFLKKYNGTGIVQANGGKSTKPTETSHGTRGGYGGKGSVNVGKIVNGEYTKIQFDIKTNDSLIGKMFALNKSEIQDITVNGKTYSTNVTVINGDMVLDGINTYTGSTIMTGTDGVSIYEFGDKETDVATATEDAQNMVILKVNGNLTINEKVRLTTCKSDDGFGGPKGFYIFCTGKIINNGEISMTARGAKAAGEDVYLLKNLNGTFEYVPASGASGGASVTFSWSAKNSTDYSVNGNVGTSGTARKTGGGASGGIYARRAGYATGNRTSGAGAAGTSYSGGSGGGGIDTNYSGTLSAVAGAANGGSGGAGYAYRGDTSWAARGGGGGAGNPGGTGKYTASGANGGSDYDAYTGENGTGGLLILYGNELENNGKIVSNGSNGGTAVNTAPRGGGSGGGSINIFVNNLIERGTITADGGAGGVSGGNGCISVGKYEYGKYVEIPVNQ